VEDEERGAEHLGLLGGAGVADRPPGVGLRVHQRALVEGDLGAPAREELHRTMPGGLATFAAFGELIEAVVEGRQGETAAATARATAAFDVLATCTMAHGLVRADALLVARAAIRDGWGDPVRWLRDSEAWFASRGLGALVRRSRALLGEAGAPVPRRGRGDSEVPESLRALGVTSRETDVLKLVVAGRTTKEIAAELYLSPKTVERHLTSLFDRTGVRNRRALAEVGATHLG